MFWSSTLLSAIHMQQNEPIKPCGISFAPPKAYQPTLPHTSVLSSSSSLVFWFFNGSLTHISQSTSCLLIPNCLLSSSVLYNHWWPVCWCSLSIKRHCALSCYSISTYQSSFDSTWAISILENLLYKSSLIGWKSITHQGNMVLVGMRGPTEIMRSLSTWGHLHRSVTRKKVG